MRRERKLTGRHVLIIALSAFAVVFAANMAMLYAATGTFPGLVVRNSYVASQGWDARTADQRALGWQSMATYRDGRVLLEMTGEDGRKLSRLNVSAVLGRPATESVDRPVDLTWDGARYTTRADLAPGAWRLDFTADNGAGDSYTATADLFVPGDG